MSHAPRNAQLASLTEAALEEARSARMAIVKQRVQFLGLTPVELRPDYVSNFAAMITNRMIDLFDDASLLLREGRSNSACIIARALMETYAFGAHSLETVTAIFEADGSKAATREIIRITNSNYFKVKEQKALKAGKFKLKDYHFTNQAKDRMTREAAEAVRVGKAMTALFNREKAATGALESRFELMYDSLCEYTHPSQVSLFGAYAEGVELVQTSFGPVHVQEKAEFSCAQGLHFMTDAAGLCGRLRDLGTKIVDRWAE